MSEKKVDLMYNSSQWQWIMGEYAKILKPFLNDIIIRFPNYYRIVSMMDLKTVLTNFIDE